MPMERVGLSGVVVMFALSLGGPASAQERSLEKELFDAGRSLFDSFGGSKRVGRSLGLDEIGRGLKEALSVGTRRVISLLGRKDGFYRSVDAHIPLPGDLRRVKRTLDRFGLGSITDDLERRLNRAAETAVPRAARIFSDAIRDMTLRDVRRIYEGPEDSATRYFQSKMTPPLVRSMRPVVDQELAQVGALQAYDRMMGQYRSLPFVPDVKADLTEHVLTKALDAVFLYLAREEAAIRRDPAKRTTQLLRRVFGRG